MLTDLDFLREYVQRVDSILVIFYAVHVDMIYGSPERELCLLIQLD